MAVGTRLRLPACGHPQMGRWQDEARLAHRGALPERIETYYEPFVGGAAVFFALASEGRFKRAVLGDLNRDLVDVYKGVKQNVDAVTSCSRTTGPAQPRDVLRDAASSTRRRSSCRAPAARLIYLNKTGYNGLTGQSLRAVQRTLRALR